MTRNLPSCVLEKFNGYETIRNDIANKEKLDFTPINIVYEPSFDEEKHVVCNFTDEIHTPYRSYLGRFDKGKERLSHRIVRQCHYCQNFFCKK